MKSSLNKLGFLVLFGTLLFLGPTWAQDPTGRIVGTVTDPGGAAVPDAKVTITNLKTGIVSTAGTDKEGFYQVQALPIGTYRVTIDHTGFRKVVFDDQLLQINQTLRVDARLEIGATS